jgi:cell division septum initiation protein DivIVA
MEDQTAILPGSLQADPFETQMRGYNKRQVDDYITRTGEQLASLEARLGAALDAAERARLEVAAVREQYQQQQPSARPAHEEVSERLSQILRLAAEEAEQERGKAETEITRIREQAEAEVEELLSRARAEADEVLSSARQEAEGELGHVREESERLLVSSREEAERLLVSSREEAERLLVSSREEAEQTLTSARDHAERLRAQAERRAAAINGVLDQRLAALTEAHGAAVHRLAEIRDTIGGLLATDSDAGSIVAGVPPVAPTELDADAVGDAAADLPAETVVGVGSEGIDRGGPDVEAPDVEAPDVEAEAAVADDPAFGSEAANPATPAEEANLTEAAPRT